MAKAKQRTLKEEADVQKNDSLGKAFMHGFTLPIRLLGRGLRWIGGKPPLKQIGKGLKRALTSKPARIIGKALGIRYIYRSLSELRTVTWPTFRESLRLVRAVILFAIVFGGLVAGVDYLLDKLFKQILL